MTPASLPELAELVENVPAGDLPALIGMFAELEARARLRLFAVRHSSEMRRASQGVAENISVDEAARQLGISASYIYKHKAELPFVIRIGRRVVCSARKVELWNERRAAAGKVLD